MEGVTGLGAKPQRSASEEAKRGFTPRVAVGLGAEPHLNERK